MRALVTGATGFVGRHVVRRLCARGDYVRVLVRRPHGGGPADALPNSAELWDGDVLDRPSIVNAAEGCEVLFHLAGLNAPGRKVTDYYRTNVGGTENVLLACAQARVHKLVVLSTARVLGDAACTNADETVPYPERYADPCAEARAVAERTVLAAHRAGDVVATIVRPGWLWGPDGPCDLLSLLRLAARGWFCWVGNSDPRVSPAHVDNLGYGLLLAAEHADANGEVFFITDDADLRLREFVIALFAAAGIKRGWPTAPRTLARPVAAGIESAHRALRFPGAPLLTRSLVAALERDQTYSCAKAKRIVAYTPPVTVEEGLSSLGAWVAGHGGLSDALRGAVL